VSAFSILISRAWLREAPPGEAEVGLWGPPCDLSRTETDLVVRVDLPGTPRGDIRLVCHPDALLIEGAKGQTVPGSLASVRQFHRVERPAGPFRRVVPLPCPVDPTRATALLRDGVLTVVLPRADP
jgi:HSP20 family protein